MIESLSLLLAVTAGVFVVFITGVGLYFKIRPNFPIRVNCWFCNVNTDVPYGNRNCWDCPSCEQYNGFFPDGGYNKVIPAQHDELLNHPVTSTKKPLQHIGPSISGKLCRKCNLNQELKIQQLASFTPLDPFHFDEEVDQYRHHLERAYRLCAACEATVSNTLQQQRIWMLDQRRKSLVHDNQALPTQRLIRLRPFWLHLSHWATTLAAAWLVLATVAQLGNGHLSFPLPAAVAYSVDLQLPPSMLTMLLVSLTHETKLTAAMAVALLTIAAMSHWRKIDIVAVFLWFILHCQCWISQWMNLELYIKLLDFKIIHLTTLFATFCVGVVAVIMPTLVSESSRSKIGSRRMNKRPKHGRDITDSFNSLDSVSEDNFDSLKSESTSTKLYSKPEPLMLTNASTLSADTLEDDLDQAILNLTLGTSRIRSRSNVSAFKTKIYGQGDGSDLFSCVGDSPRHCNRPVLSPPKFHLRKNVTQTSWVAGGYWQVPGTLGARSGASPSMSGELPSLTPLSRSSSQSSGFGSQCSQFAASLPNSRTGSTCAGDADCFSVLSEPVYRPLFTSPHPAFLGMHCYGGPPVFVHHAYTPHGFLSPFGLPVQNHVIPQYFPHKSALTGIPWPTSTTSTQLNKQLSPLRTDILGQSGSSGLSNHRSQSSVVRVTTVNAYQNFLYAVKDNMLLATVFFISLLFNVLALGYIARSQNFIRPYVP